ncbi:uncharacterized protein TNCV_2596571 [Trichonephila clavipes]|nr:uncharacterized protein TNCV_2596571 [Trichonephila clavipes]
MHVKYVEDPTSSRWCGGDVRRGECQLRCHLRHLNVIQNYEWLAKLTAVPWSLGSNPGEGMAVCKCIVPLRHGGTLNSRRTANPFDRLVEGEERWEASNHP